MRFIDDILCCNDKELRFYAGALLQNAEGIPLGTLCVFDYAPKKLSVLQQQGLQILADQVMARLELRKSLKRAVLLRQEVDHRVKNSLQILGSFIRVAKRYTFQPETETALSMVEARITAMTKVHERLYRQPATVGIMLEPYLSQLSEDLAALAPDGVHISSSIDDILVRPADAVALGTLVTELVSNVFKHAFPERREGSVRIVLKKCPDTPSVRLTCADDGIGSLLGTPSESGLGMKVAEVLAAELRGSVNVQSDRDGFLIALEFPSGMAM